MIIKLKCGLCRSEQDPQAPRAFGSCGVCQKLICPDCTARAGRHLLPSLCMVCLGNETARTAVGLLMTRTDFALDEYAKDLEKLSLSLGFKQQQPPITENENGQPEKP